MEIVEHAGKKYKKVEVPGPRCDGCAFLRIKSGLDGFKHYTCAVRDSDNITCTDHDAYNGVSVMKNYIFEELPK